MSANKTEFREEVIRLAETWLSDMSKKSSISTGLVKKLDKLLTDPKNKTFLIELLDKSFRGQSMIRIDQEIRYILKKYDMHTIFSKSELFNFFEKILIHMYYTFGRFLPWISVPIFKEKIRQDSSAFVIKEEKINKFLNKQSKDGIHCNINKIGESVIGEEEAKDRLEGYQKVIRESNIGHIAVKISTIYSQINSISMKHTVEILVDRLSLLYRTAKNAYYTDAMGNKFKKWIHLDMEEYRDLEITVEVFFKTLDQEEFFTFDRADIAIQAYMPEALLWYEKILNWAKKRVDGGGAPVKVRLVKGANMEMEMTESALRGWPLVTYSRKIDTDSNYKKILELALKKENVKYVKFGIASHNLFDVIYGYLLSKHYDSQKYVYFEMLEGMAETLRNKLLENGQTVLLYVPTSSRKFFTSAIGYLVRRLDENTNRDNFMRYSFGLKVNSPEFEMLKNQFRQSYNQLDKVYIGKNRKQDRSKEKFEHRPEWKRYSFVNESDTDFALKENRDWIDKIVERFKNMDQKNIFIDIGMKTITKNREKIDVYDYSRKTPRPIGSYLLQKEEDMKEVIDVAIADKHKWSETSLDEIYTIFSKAAHYCRERRGELIGIAAAELGKIVTELDPEISEAIDFINFYSLAACQNKKENLKMKPKGIVVVISPWNFPIGIPVGGIAAALSVGNRVIFKASSDAVLSGYEVCKLFWDAGVPRDALQYVTAKGSDFGNVILSDKRIKNVILTGGEETAYKILEDRPDIILTGETGGKNAIIIGTIADVDLAISHVLSSAFGNSGQKCSACSLLIVPNDLLKKKAFLDNLKDATESMEVGSQWDLKNKISRLVRKPNGALKKAINHIEPHETWLVEPKFVGENEYMLRPSIRIGTKRGDFTHKTELFGPHLSVMGYSSLQEAIDIVHETGYGLTSGIHTLDEREREYFLQRIQAGNVYVNRGITGAMVLRQPFGGLGKSAIGSGRKVGYYNYLLQFMDVQDHLPYYDTHLNKDFLDIHLEDHELKDPLKNFYKEAIFEKQEYKNDMKYIAFAFNNYIKAKENHFIKDHDEFKLRGEDNILRYKPAKRILVRIHESNTIIDVLLRILGAKIVAEEVYLSIPSTININELKYKYLQLLMKYQEQFGINILIDTDEELSEKLFDFDRIRYANHQDIPQIILQKAAKKGFYINAEKPIMEGRYELLNYYYEQSISNSYHRYGNLGERGVKE